ncbi:Crp/Fnr family transcriptional regulator [Streptomyces sp. NPDC002596]|uniref:Crp/Fnr family transcriptional regulator n=1 Tax=unclassified Streptomyces TaxID=2593676 RepID=UPI0022566E43|nr:MULTISPECIES: cyclic nucleotide-binding domain-containing protein [unclassified Streptomyces]MCX4530569.1 cyclic nucleotide-binding domain-containing protein [Streptomyces sp. NBC_01669]WSA03677.1 cyclic nucleotide-binding domain-containing protein [Streptomyces sp. NBC_00841]WSJ93561.1 cyclic nucleotide-binding domain-containing protein [Streptomyces sp. NBC_01320]
MTTPTIRSLGTKHRDRLMQFTREVSFPEGTRIFEEGQRADHFWIVRTGTVSLDFRMPKGPPAVIESLGHGELIGWSWLFSPYVWQLGAEAMTHVRAYELDAAQVRHACDLDPELAAAVALWVGRVIAHRLQSARARLLDLYAPHGSGLPHVT